MARAANVNDLLNQTVLERAISLSLSDCDLSEIPDRVWTMEWLQELAVGRNRLTILPDGIGNLVRLTYLNIHRNSITLLPESIGNLRLLSRACLTNNRLQALPTSIANMSRLEVLLLANNELMEIPEHLLQISNLRELDLSGNRLRELPHRLSALTQLRQLVIHRNYIRSVPPELFDLRALEELGILQNPLRLSLTELERLSSLRVLQISDDLKHASARFALTVEHDDTESLVRSIRDQCAQHDFATGHEALTKLHDVAPDRYVQLRDELSFLYGAVDAPEGTPQPWEYDRQLATGRSCVWALTAEHNSYWPFAQDTVSDEAIAHGLSEMMGPEPDGNSADSQIPPHEQGENLERSVLALLRMLFSIESEMEATLVTKLRQQGKGLQFGCDLSFDCLTSDRVPVRCHVECKSTDRPLRPEDIAHKLATTEMYSPDIDHWVLIAPLAQPNNELDRLFEFWQEKRKFPFRIHLWTKDRGAQDLFALVPTLYSHVYSQDVTVLQKTSWPEERRTSVLERFRDLLRPNLQLPPTWENYLRSPLLMCMKDDEGPLFPQLRHNYVPQACADIRRTTLDPSAHHYVETWLADPESEILLLLGDFGVGKTFFTYVLSCTLAEQFLRSPRDGWIPLRLPLRGIGAGTALEAFVQARLDGFGGKLADLPLIRQHFRLAVFLDGFDEMSLAIDSRSIQANIRRLADYCSLFKGAKIIVTSRSNIFENLRYRRSLLERLPSPRLCYLLEPERSVTYHHLEMSVGDPLELATLRQIQPMDDPIGLARKPLYLQMLKATLRFLPAGPLNENKLYDTYIEQSLRRKMELLDDDAHEALPSEIRGNLEATLENIALAVHVSGQDHIDLADFVAERNRSVAAMLWRLSEPTDYGAVEGAGEPLRLEDATARIGIRSLLVRSSVGPLTGEEWPVQFCHRSMCEFFVARRLCRAMREGGRDAIRIISAITANHEILSFTALRMREEPASYVSGLQSIVHSHNWPGGRGCGTTVSLLFRVAGELPGAQWDNLSLDGADLSGADLSGKSFRGSSLRDVVLNNTNLDDVDFTDADLTGAQFEQTAMVLGVAQIHATGELLAAYEDGKLRSWLPSKWGARSKVLAHVAGLVKSMWSLGNHDLAIVTDKSILYYDCRERGSLDLVGRFDRKNQFNSLVADGDTLLLVPSNTFGSSDVVLVDLLCRRRLCSVPAHGTIVAASYGKSAVVRSEGAHQLIVYGRSGQVMAQIRFPDIASVDVGPCEDTGAFIVTIGSAGGVVSVWKVFMRSELAWTTEELAREQLHSGLVSSVKVIDETAIASGGEDRCVVLSCLRSDDSQWRLEKRESLHLSIRCRGVKIGGVRGRLERQRLQQLSGEVVAPVD